MLYKEKSAGIAPTISPLDVNVYGPVPILDVEALYWCLRHHPGIVNHDVDPPDPLTAVLTNLFTSSYFVTSVGSARALPPRPLSWFANAFS